MPLYRYPVTLNYAIGSKKGVNTWHLRTGVPLIPGTPTLGTIIQNFYTGIKSLIPSDMTAQFEGVITEVGVEEPSVVPAVPTWSVAGTGTAGQYGSAGVGLCVGWRSTLATRRGRGRTFISPVALVVVNSPDGTINDTNLGAARTAAGALVSASLADGNGAVVVFSPTDNLGRDIVSYKINDKVAWLSSRRG